MVDNRLKITRLIIHEFGSITKFEGNFSDIVLIESGINSRKIEDILFVLRDFMNIGLLMGETTDVKDDFVSQFNAKFGKRSYIEVGFTFDEHAFYYRHFYDMDGILNRYVRDVQSRFTMRGELCYNFLTYIMNPYAMNIANVTSMIGEGNTSEYFPDAFKELWHNICEYNPIQGINSVFDYNKDNYNRIMEDMKSLYPCGMELPENIRCELYYDGLNCIVDNKRVYHMETLDRREQKIYQFACYIMANEVISRVQGISDKSLSNGPLLLDMELYWDIEDADVLKMLRQYLLPLTRQVFIAESPNINSVLWQDSKITSITIITDGNEGLQCVTRALF